VLASWYGGNAELVLLCAALLATRLLWTGPAAPAAPLIALTILVKPPYALLFAAFGLLQLVTRPGEARATLRRLAVAAALALGLAALEVARWGPALRAETLDYVLHAAAAAARAGGAGDAQRGRGGQDRAPGGHGLPGPAGKGHAHRPSGVGAAPEAHPAAGGVRRGRRGGR
jgi:hypothetical protein